MRKANGWVLFLELLLSHGAGKGCELAQGEEEKAGEVEPRS